MFINLFLYNNYKYQSINCFSYWKFVFVLLYIKAISLALGTKVFKGEGRKLSFWVLWLVLEERDSDFSNLPWWGGRERDRKIGESQKFCIWALANLIWKYQHYKRLLCLSTNTRMLCEWYSIKCSFYYNSFDLEKCF